MNAGHFALGSKLPSADACVLPRMLDKQAARFPDRTLVVFDQGQRWTYAEARRLARGTASALQALGVARGERVLILLPDGPVIVRLHLAISYIGAIYVPINTALRGNLLEHIINSAKSTLLIIHSDFVDRLERIATPQLRSVVVVDGQQRVAKLDQVQWLDESRIAPMKSELMLPDPPLEPWDIQAIFYTSGTTGPSKGVLCTHVHTWYMAVGGIPFLRESDRYMSPSAYFHIAGAYVPWAVIYHGASMAIVGIFRSGEFWSQIKRTGTTATIVIGAMADFLLKAPPSPDDANNALRVINQQPLAHDAPAFAERFNVQLYTQFDMTEVGPAIASDVFGAECRFDMGYCGRVRDGFEIRLMDEFDREVPLGEVGELSVRCRLPWLIAHGYFDMPQASEKAWRNGWFHSGDAFRRDEAGNYYFVDRLKDAIRRRGENISSMEVEQELLSYPSVNAVAAYAAPSEHGEDEVMVAIEPVAGTTIEPKTLVEFLIPRMAHFMVPRYFRFLETLPRSATDKIQKPALRDQGVTADTWDRIAAGIEVKRNAVVRKCNEDRSSD